MVPSSAQLPLSVVIVAKNEAHNLPRCLASVQGWVAEIVVLLNDTTDASATVAREYGATVHEDTWRGYRDTKNLGLEKASQLWIFSIDADEEVSTALRNDVTGFFRRGDHERYSGAKFPRKVWFIDRWITHGDWYPDLSLRLFRRDRGHWGGDAHVHEKIEIDGAVARLNGDLHHFSFPTLASHVSKINLFAGLFVRQQLEKQGTFSAVAVVLRPWWRFFRAYILRLGCLDGFPGFYIACATSFSTLVRYSSLYEHARQKPPPPLSPPPHV